MLYARVRGTMSALLLVAAMAGAASSQGAEGAAPAFREIAAPLRLPAWDGPLRQPVLLADPCSLVSVLPQPGFQHRLPEADTLGTDRPESPCRSR